MKKFTFKGVLDGFRQQVQPQMVKPEQEIPETLRPEHFQLKKVSTQPHHIFHIVRTIYYRILLLIRPQYMGHVQQQQKRMNRTRVKLSKPNVRQKKTKKIQHNNKKRFYYNLGICVRNQFSLSGFGNVYFARV